MEIKIDYDTLIVSKKETLQKFIDNLQKTIEVFDFNAVVVVNGLPNELMANYESKIIEKYMEYDIELQQYIPCFWYNKRFFNKFGLTYNITVLNQE